MSKSAFTPGPWRVDGTNEDVGVCVMAGATRWICGEIDNDPERIPIELEAHHGLSAEEVFALRAENVANACLIAAAPELYRNLEMAAKQFRKYEALHREKDTDEGRKKANSNMMFAQLCEWALAAARGEAKRSTPTVVALESDRGER